MKKTIPFIMLLVCMTSVFGQDTSEKEKIERACLNYLEGFYEGDTTKLVQSLQPKLYKFGFMKNREGDGYREVPAMTYQAAMDFAMNVKEKKRFPKPDAPKKVQVLDIGNTIASAKVTAWWGIDYLLLSKRNKKWMIEQVLWEGPLVAEHLKNKS